MAYYTGDSVPLKFTVTDSGGAVTPSAAKVGILKPSKVETAEVNATIATNTISYTVPASVTDEQGLYKAYFRLTLTYGERTHKVEFSVIANPEK